MPFWILTEYNGKWLTTIAEPEIISNHRHTSTHWVYGECIYHTYFAESISEMPLKWFYNEILILSQSMRPIYKVLYHFGSFTSNANNDDHCFKMSTVLILNWRMLYSKQCVELDKPISGISIEMISRRFLLLYIVRCQLDSLLKVIFLVGF